jgi:hypothetical protein
VLAVPKNVRAADQDMFDTDRILMRLLVCRAVCDRHWVEDNDICEHSLANKAAPIKS